MRESIDAVGSVSELESPSGPLKSHYGRMKGPYLSTSSPVKDKKGFSFTIAALLIRMVGIPSWMEISS